MSSGKRFKENTFLEKKKVFYIFGVLLFIILLITIMAVSTIRAKKDAISKVTDMDVSEAFDATMVSYTEDKGLNEVQNNLSNEEQGEKIAINTSNLPENVLNVTQTNSEPEAEEEKVIELHFVAPVDGEITKDFSDSNLIYSETLEEWTVHLGIDIEAQRGTPVNSSEAGKIESIKNDPRYGTTVTVEHANGFKTIYSNLQTAEFISEGQEVEKGQIIGSVGDNAPFEIADGAHLHMEMTLNGESVNPALYFEG